MMYSRVPCWGMTYLQLFWLLGSVPLLLCKVPVCLMLQSLFKVYSVWYKYCYLCFLFICMEYFFLPTSFQCVCVCVSRSEMNLLQAACIRILFFLIHSVTILLDSSVYLYILIYSFYWYVCIIAIFSLSLKLLPWFFACLCLLLLSFVISWLVEMLFLFLFLPFVYIYYRFWFMVIIR